MGELPAMLKGRLDKGASRRGNTLFVGWNSFLSSLPFLLRSRVFSALAASSISFAESSPFWSVSIAAMTGIVRMKWSGDFFWANFVSDTAVFSGVEYVCGGEVLSKMAVITAL